MLTMLFFPQISVSQNSKVLENYLFYVGNKKYITFFKICLLVFELKEKKKPFPLSNIVCLRIRGWLTQEGADATKFVYI